MHTYVHVLVYKVIMMMHLYHAQVVVNGYYAKEGKSCLRADSNFYSGTVYSIV